MRVLWLDDAPVSKARSVLKKSGCGTVPDKVRPGLRVNCDTSNPSESSRQNV